MIRISASLIKDYLACSNRGYFRINHPEYSEKSPEAEVGTLVHKAIQRFPKGTYQELYSYVEKNADFLSATHLKKASRCVNNYTRTFSNFLSPAAKLEYKFNYMLGDIQIVGILDGFDGATIVDWKTAEKVPTSSELSDDIQFNLYYEIMKRSLGYSPTLYYVSLTKNTMLDFHPNQEIIDIIFEELIPDIHSSITNNRFIRTGIFTGSCKYCQFYSACRGRGE